MNDFVIKLTACDIEIGGRNALGVASSRHNSNVCII